MKNPSLTNPIFSVELICRREVPAGPAEILHARLLSINLQRVLRKAVHAWIAEQRVPGLDFRISSGEHIQEEPTVLDLQDLINRDPNVNVDFAKLMGERNGR